MNQPSEYLKIRYAAPPNACKCGDCQLVPHKVIQQWVEAFERLRALGRDLDASIFEQFGHLYRITDLGQRAKAAFGDEQKATEGKP